jgi:hypothetical protein
MVMPPVGVVAYCLTRASSLACLADMLAARSPDMQQAQQVSRSLCLTGLGGFNS